MNLRIKKFVRGLVAIVLVAVICLALQVVIVPNIVRRVILSSLADIGLSGATLEVRSCSWRGAEFANVELGEDRCACFAAVTAEYSIGSLLRGKLNKIQVTGGQLLVRIRDGKIELGELARIRFKDNERASGPVVDRIELRACVLLVNWHKKQICIPCEGSIINSGSDWTVHDLQLNFQGTPVQMSAAFYSKGKSLVFSLDGRRIDLRALMAALPAEILDLPERWVGQADVKLQGDISIVE